MFSPVDTAYEPLPHTRLSAKNVQALKAVFNIAHCMGGLLGASWSLVLDTFEQLDRIIAGSKTTASGGVRAVELATATGGPEATSNELSILSAALNNLFEGSVRLDDVAIAHFLTALSTSCFASLAHEATSRERVATPGSAAAQPPRLFALSKFVDTVLINLKRIRILWPLVTQFLLPVANHQTQRIRVLGMESLSKVLIASMRMHIADQAAAAKKDSGGPGRGSAHDAWDYVLLAPLEELQRRCAHRETQEKIISAMHEVLMTCGAGLTDGWLLLLSILWRAATKPSLVPLLPNAFRSVQLIASDFLPHLPPACLPAYVEVAAAFATQQSQLNVSLTAVGLQWTIGDHLFMTMKMKGGVGIEDDGEEEDAAAAKKGDEEEERMVSDARAAEEAEEEPSSATMRSPGTLKAEAAEGELAQEEGTGSALASAPRYGDLNIKHLPKTHMLWCSVLRQLRRLCVDKRPELRRCTLETLAQIISSHGHALSGKSLDHLIHRTLLPLLTEVIVQANCASSESSAQKLGTEGGKDVLMMMHHSRDTAAKQWSETWVLALGSVARVYRSFLHQLMRRKRFGQAWDALLQILQSSILALPRSQEVALAAISASHTLLLSSARGPHSRQNSMSDDKPPPSTPGSGPPGSIPIAAPLSPPMSSPPGGGGGGKGGISTAAPTRSSDGQWTTPSISGSIAIERERLPPRLWASVWALLEKAVEVATQDAHSFGVHEKMLTSLVSRTAELYDGGREHFEEADVLRMLQLAERLARSPDAASGWDPTVAATVPTGLQNAVLTLLGKLPPFHAGTVREEEMWPLLLWLLLKLMEPPPAQPPPVSVAGAPATAPPVTTPGKRVVVGFAERCYALLHTLLTEQAGPAAKLAVAEDVLNVMRNLMSWRLHPLCECPSLPRAAASGFVSLLHALLPHLPQPEEGAARRAHVELIEALWARIAPPATRPHERSRGRSASGPPVAQPLASLPLAALTPSDEDVPPPPPLPTGGGDDDLDLESSTLAAARRVLLSTSMQPALRRRLLQLPCAVLALPPHAAALRDECWRNAASTLCMLSARAAGSQQQFGASPEEEAAAAAGAGGGGGACASLAAPMLVDAAAAALRGWSASEPGELPADASNARASQIAHLLSLLASLTLPDGVLPDPAAVTAAGGGAAGSSVRMAARRGKRAHLLHLAPCLIECIGQPAHLYASGAVPPAAAELSAGVRRLLHLMAQELQLE